MAAKTTFVSFPLSASVAVILLACFVSAHAGTHMAVAVLQQIQHFPPGSPQKPRALALAALYGHLPRGDLSDLCPRVSWSLIHLLRLAGKDDMEDMQAALLRFTNAFVMP